MSKRVIVHFREDEYATLVRCADAMGARPGPFCRLLLEGPRPLLVSDFNRKVRGAVAHNNANFAQVLAHLLAPSQSPTSVDLLALLQAADEAIQAAGDAMTGVGVSS